MIEAESRINVYLTNGNLILKKDNDGIIGVKTFPRANGAERRSGRYRSVRGY